jgi:hypothetical protein
LIDDLTNTLVGIVSFGTNDPTCMDGITGGFTRISGYSGWLIDKLCTHSISPPSYIDCAARTEFPTFSPTTTMEPTREQTLYPTDKCVDQGDFCQYDFECCSMNDWCIGSKCSCVTTGDYCFRNGDCCGFENGNSKCNNYRCAKCSKKKRVCTRNAECCSGKCIAKKRGKNGKCA